MLFCGTGFGFNFGKCLFYSAGKALIPTEDDPMNDNLAAVGPKAKGPIMSDPS